MVAAFSFCLYGPPGYKYYDGFRENVQLIAKYFPEWVVYLYAGADVPEEFLQSLPHEVRIRKTGLIGADNMIQRFTTIDEPDVDVVFFRDADSRVFNRDRRAIREFLDSGYGAHVIRDHVLHPVVLLGGLWGIRRGVLQKPMSQFVAEWDRAFRGNGVDQDFLMDCIYPSVRSVLLVHVQFRALLFAGESSRVLPLLAPREEHCGAVILQPTADIKRPLAFIPQVFVKLSR